MQELGSGPVGRYSAGDSHAAGAMQGVGPHGALSTLLS